MSYYVYIHEFPNGKRYVGATVQSLKWRWWGGKGYRSGLIKKAIEEFGWENVKHYFYTLPENKKLMYALERYLINHFGTTDPANGYNCGDGGTKNQRFNKATRDLMSEHHADVSGKNNPRYGKTPPNVRRILVNGVEYESIDDAIRKTGISRYSMYKMLKEGGATYVNL